MLIEPLEFHLNPLWRLVLRVARWLIHTPTILAGLSLTIIIGSLVASFYLNEWHWFQRFGALSVSIGAVLSTRRILRFGIDGALRGETYFEVIARRVTDPWNMDDEETYCDLLCSYWGFWIVGIGTIIWAFGDLLGLIF